jgi:hypothetical protein
MVRGEDSEGSVSEGSLPQREDRGVDREEEILGRRRDQFQGDLVYEVDP